MNKERYLKLKKDFIVLYLARNGIMTFFITLCAFGIRVIKVLSNITNRYNSLFIC